MAYDAARQRVVLFGGVDGTGYRADTWEWNGSNWSPRTTASGPSARRAHAMAYDAARQRVVLFGGWDGSARLSDTWEWDGSAWTRRGTASGPSARLGHAMAYDVARQRVVLFGGEGPSDTWEWDGVTWSQRAPATVPVARSLHTMAYDVARQCVVLFGGGHAHGYLSETWLYSPRPARAQAFGTACSGSSVAPVLTSSAPYLGHSAFALELVGARPAAACLFGLATATQAQAIGPCTLYLKDLPIALPAASNWAGFAETSRFAIPLDVGLRGVTLHAQAFVVDPRGPVLGLTFSAGRTLVLGD
jgi:hypothetical protein